jgi:DNA-binding beta-propeller fold protein YncE
MHDFCSPVDRREWLKAAGFTTLYASTLSWPILATAQSDAFNPHRYVFALRGDGIVAVIDPNEERVIRNITTTGRGGTLGTFTRDLKKLYVGNNAPNNRKVSVIDTENLNVRQEIETGNRPKHPLVSPDGKWLAINHSGMDDNQLRVTFVSTADDSIVRQVNIPVRNTSHAGDFSMHGAWSPDGAIFAIGNYADNKIILIQSSDFRYAEIETRGNPHYFDWRGREMWAMVEFDKPRQQSSLPQIVIVDATQALSPRVVTQFSMSRQDADTRNETFVEGHHGTFTNDGRRYISLNRGSGPGLPGVTVDVYDAATRQRLASLNANAPGVGHAYCTPDGRYALITQYNSMRLPVLDLQTLRIITTVDAGKGGHLGHAVFTQDGKKAFVSNRISDEVIVIDTGTWQIRNRISTAASGSAQGMVANAFYGVFERVVQPLLS